MLFIGIELAVITLFIIALVDALRHYKSDKRKLWLLGLGLVYAMIFENFNMILSKGNIGSYFYNPEFNIYIWHTPVFIILAWAVLIYTAMHLTDWLRIKTVSKPFLDALIIVMIDISMDVVAVRQNLWTWIGYSSNQGWFGVPADNFIGWLLVAFTFSFLFRYFTRQEDDMINKTTRSEFYFLLPVFSYLGMLVIFSLVNLAEDIFRLTKAEEIFIFLVMVILFASLIRRSYEDKPIFKTDKFTIFVVLFTRLLFYTYTLYSIALMNIWQESLWIPLILFSIIAAEILLYSSIWKDTRSNELPHY